MSSIKSINHNGIKADTAKLNIKLADMHTNKEPAIRAESWKILRVLEKEDREKAIQNIINRIKNSYWL